MVKSDAWAKSEFNSSCDVYCQYCNKLCKNLNSLKQHECRCSNNPDRRCSDNLSKYITANRKGRTKDNCPEIAKQAETLKQKYADGYQSPMKGKPGTFLGKHHTAEAKRNIGKHVSESRLKSYADGKISPAFGVGKGKYSSIVYKDKKYTFRSTYEFIYALYLLSEGVEFEYENIRVPSISSGYSKTLFCDFNIGNKIIEIKGDDRLVGKQYDEKLSFEAQGYEFVIYFEEDILRFSEDLKHKGYDIDDLIVRINKGHETKNYFVYEFASSG